MISGRFIGSSISLFETTIISSFYRQFNKTKAKELKILELDTKAKLEITITSLYEDPYNIGKQGEVSLLQNTIDGIVTNKARGVVIHIRVIWQKLDDKCTTYFFKSIKQKYPQAVISLFKDKYGKTFTNRNELDMICHDFYEDLYKHKEYRKEPLKRYLKVFR